MNRFFSRHRKLLLWLASDLALLLLFWALRPWRAGMETIVAASAAFRRSSVTPSAACLAAALAPATASCSLAISSS